MSVNKYNSTTGNLERLDGYTVDSTPTQNSGNPVSSGGVFTALDGKVDKGDEISVTADGTKNLGQVLADLASLLVNAGIGKINASSYVTIGTDREIFRFSYRTAAGEIYFSTTFLHGNTFQCENVYFDCTNEPYSGKYLGYTASSGSISDYSSDSVTVGRVFKLHF